MARRRLIVAFALVAMGGAWARPAVAAPPTPEALGDDYRRWLDAGRSPTEVVATTVAMLGDRWRVIDPAHAEVRSVSPGDRLVFVRRDRTTLLVVVGRQPLARAGARLIVAHIDTPSPRLLAYRKAGCAKRWGCLRLRAFAYGGLKKFHWLSRPVGLVGRAVLAGGHELDVRLGIDDDFGLWITKVKGSYFEVSAASSPLVDDSGAGGALDRALDATLRGRFDLGIEDLVAAELYVVPRANARVVGVDRALIGAHGHDDRVNSFCAARAIADLAGTPERTAIVWLVDREEVGSNSAVGATSQAFELAIAYLLRARGEAASERALARAIAAFEALSADTPGGLNPIFPEPHIERIAPRIGRGPVVFPYIGSGGKRGSNVASAQSVRAVLDAFAHVHASIQVTEFSRVDTGGGGTVASELAQRGIDVVDIGVPVVSIHTPLELAAITDIHAAYLGYGAWLAGLP